MSDLPPVPLPSDEDRDEEFIRRLADMVPTVGPLLSLFLGHLFRGPLQERRTAWLEQVRQAVIELQHRRPDITPEALYRDPVWVSAFMQATAIASKTHRAEKLLCLRNALISAANPARPDEDMMHAFLHLVDRLSVGHVRILEFLDSPNEWALNYNRPIMRGQQSTTYLVSQLFPELTMHDFHEKILSDLHTEGLAGNYASLLILDSGTHGTTLPLGRAFLDFVQGRDTPRPPPPSSLPSTAPRDLV